MQIGEALTQCRSLFPVHVAPCLDLFGSKHQLLEITAQPNRTEAPARELLSTLGDVEPVALTCTNVLKCSFQFDRFHMFDTGLPAVVVIVRLQCQLDVFA